LTTRSICCRRYLCTFVKPSSWGGWGAAPYTPRSSLRSRLRIESLQLISRSEGPVSKSSYFLGDPPPDPRFLASLGALSLVELPFMERTLLVELHTFGAKWSFPRLSSNERNASNWWLLQGSEGALPVTTHRANRENGGLGEDPPGSTMTY
jgi:hypothetical protein